MEIFECLFDTRNANILKSVLGRTHFDNLKLILNDHLIEYLYLNKPESLKYIKLICDLKTQVSDEEFTKLPKYDTSTKEVVIVRDKNMENACKLIKRQRFVGYDTESKPVFKKGQPPNRIALIQIATRQKCFLFQIRQLKNISPLLELLKCNEIRKIGVGVKHDNTQLFRNFGCKVANVVELNEIFQEMGNKNTIGSKQLVARVLKKNLEKKQKISLSNWEINPLSQQQIRYASDDAFSALEVFLKLKNSLTQFNQLAPKRILSLLAIK
jgi:ribonuclease D